jgi:hypothetical protein
MGMMKVANGLILSLDKTPENHLMSWTTTAQDGSVINQSPHVNLDPE